ncbi:MAG TPA: CBS domain-containing protein [Thermoanaerobaculia bacterium]|nr:CBS domain-containing protein [Thermoanaerobaculia bacterium]
MSVRVGDIMTRGPASCAPATTLRLVAQLMADHDCAAIPVVSSGKLAGIVTDRDIACRAVAGGGDSRTLTAAQCMSQPVIVIGPDEPIERAIELMEENAVHHLPVMDQDGRLVGILAQSDVGRRMTNRQFGAMARMTSIRTRHSRAFVSALVKTEH